MIVSIALLISLRITIMVKIIEISIRRKTYAKSVGNQKR